MFVMGGEVVPPVWGVGGDRRDLVYWLDVQISLCVNQWSGIYMSFRSSISLCDDDVHQMLPFFLRWSSRLASINV